MDYRKILLDKVNKLISKEWAVPQFEKEYYSYYLNEVPEKALNNDELMFFGEIQEKLDWTAEKLSNLERYYGWLDFDQYLEYVKRITDDFLKTEKYNSDSWGKIMLEIRKQKSKVYVNRNLFKKGDKVRVKKIKIHYSHFSDGVDVSTIYFKNLKKAKSDGKVVRNGVILTAGEKSADLTDLPCDLELDFDKDGKLISIQIIGNVMPDDLIK